MAKIKSTKQKQVPKGKFARKTNGSEAAGKSATPIEEDGEEPSAEVTDFSSLQKIFEEASKAEESGFGLRATDVECPHCGEEFEISVDPREEGQEMIQDCSICCRAIKFAIDIIDDEVVVSAYQD